MLKRELEPEVMDTAEEAQEYDAMDHGAVNATFCDDVLAQGPLGPAVLDVGTGTALIPIEVARRLPNVRIVATDLAAHMLALATANLARAGLQDRVMLERIDAKQMPYPSGAFDVIISNSLVHHIPEPLGVLAELQRVAAPGALVFVRDLARPSSEAEVERLVGLYGGQAPAQPSPSFERQRQLLRASLRAALTLDEITEMARSARMPADAVRMTSDRHWTLSYRNR